jgi:SAM-dependent methyltransferase
VTLDAIRRHFNAQYATGVSPLDLALQALLPEALTNPDVISLRSSGFLTSAGLARLRAMAMDAMRLPLHSEPLSLLDAGCGRGRVGTALAESAGARLTGVDFVEAAVAAARAERRQPDASFVVADIAAMPFPNGAFDAACALDTLHLLPDPLPALRELRRVLAPGGVLFGGLYQLASNVSSARRMEDWRDTFAGAGFGAQQWQDVSPEWRSVMQGKHARRLAERAGLVAAFGDRAEMECDVSRQMLGAFGEPGFIARNARFEFFVTAA